MRNELSAEQIKKFQWNYNKHDGMGNPDGWVNTLCDMALSSLRAEKERAEAERDAALKEAERFQLVMADIPNIYTAMFGD